MRKALLIPLFFWLFMAVSPAAAHANLSRSNPPANATVNEPPEEIRLWFTETIEPAFSSITLRDSDGNLVNTPDAVVDDPFQLALAPGDLPNGVYTVSWKVVSKTDGHLTQGSFSFGIGQSVQPAAVSIKETIPFTGALVRWLNLVSLALVVGSVGFRVLVWRPASRSVALEQETSAGIERRMNRLIGAGWGFLGLTTALILLLQGSILGETTLFQATSVLESVLRDTYFGELWQIRVGLWLLLGVVLLWENPRGDWLSLALGGGILLTQSLFSHASSALDKNAAAAADWLHLVGMALWIGGLVQLVNVLAGVRQNFRPYVSYFSNYARVGVILLVVTGLYASWLHVGGVEALADTRYGQALLLKLVLFVPVLVIAGINMVSTRRGLVAAEIVLTVGILAAVGVMTAIAPARTTLALREGLPQAPVPIIEKQFKTNLNAALTVSSGWAGENRFSLHLADRDGNPLDDATLIRLRFENQDQSLGESELNPQPQGDGLYAVSGANLSVPGEWRIRTTIQRPNTYDVVMDFTVQITAAPPPPPAADPAPPENYRFLALVLLGVGLLGAGGYTLRKPTHVLAAPVLIGAGIILISTGGLKMASKESNRVLVGYQAAPDAPIQVIPLRGSAFPMLITADGTLLQPDSAGSWGQSALESPVHDAYLDATERLWAAADDGLYVFQDGEWQKKDAVPTVRLVDTHGYLFALGSGEITRLGSGELESGEMILDIPHPDGVAEELVMLGSHSHVLLNGEEVFLTPDLGLSWQPLKAPESIHHITTDADGTLLASTPDGLYRWDYSQWQKISSLPDGTTVIETYNNRVMVIAGGRLYLQAGNAWQEIELPDSEGAYLTDLAFQFPDTLWVLDSAGRRLWSTQDGKNWKITPL